MLFKYLDIITCIVEKDFTEILGIIYMFDARLHIIKSNTYIIKNDCENILHDMNKWHILGRASAANIMW